MNTTSDAARAGNRIFRDLLQWFIASLLLTGLPASSVAEEEQLIPLWADDVPLATGDEEADTPALWVYQAPDGGNGAAVVICPGGGYAVHAVDHEGTQPARWLNRRGITAFVLRYRLAPYRHPAPLLDAQRAIRLVRSRAEEFDIDPDRIGVMGFSAGGHLASTAATHFDAGDSSADDVIDRSSCRPSFVILGYPVVSLQDDITHRGSVRNLLGDAPTDDQRTLLSNQLQVTADSPPAFLFHTAEDSAVQIENSLQYFAACRKAGVPAELHAFQHGQHGVGLANQHPALTQWMELAGIWLRQNGLLTSAPTQLLRGTVTVDGKPLQWGAISFESDDAHNPVGWSMVMRGRYSIPESAGIVAGDYRVRLTDMGDVQPRPTVSDARQLPKSLTVHVANGQQELDVAF